MHDSRPRILVVGAGLAGLGAAWHLAPHARVTVLEQGEHPLAEASAQNAGMVRRLVIGDHERELAVRSDARLRELPQGPGDDWHELAPFRRTGAVLALEHDDGRLDAAARDLRARGITVDEPSLSRVARIAPALRGAPLARIFHVPDEGTCDAWSLGQGLLRGALRHGARLRLGVRVLRLHARAGRIVGASTSDGAEDADLVVIAAGAWSSSLARGLGVERTLTPRARHLFQSTPHPTFAAASPHPWCWIDDAGLYLRPEAGGFLMSPCDETDETPAEGPGSRGAPREEARDSLVQKLTRLCPTLADLGIGAGWVGYRTFTPSRAPLCGRDPEIDGLAWIAGLGGFGVTCALALAEDLTRALCVAR
ncbi:MAG: FAD-binding oxidoreductase [Planctomycetota bacterium]